MKDLGHEVINFGIFEDEETEISYIQTAILVSMLLSSKTVDFVVTGCSSGQGMMLACNSLPDVLCGFVENPSDAYLFGRINGGNSISYPLGLNFGWASEINLQNTLNSLFDGPFGVGYPETEAARKQQDSKYLKQINRECKCKLLELLVKLDESLMQGVYSRQIVINEIIEHGQNQRLIQMLKERQS